MQVNYHVEVIQAMSLEEFEEIKSGQNKICFAFLRESPSRYIKVRMYNRLDKSSFAHISTKEWLEMWMPEGGEGILDWEVREKYFSITLDLHQMSYGWALTFLTLFRYPGEFWNIVYNFWRLKQETPTLDKWQLLYMAHQVYLPDFPAEIYTKLSFNCGHSLFASGNNLSFKVDKNRALVTLKAHPCFPDTFYNTIQEVWGTGGYGSCRQVTVEQYKELCNAQ